VSTQAQDDNEFETAFAEFAKNGQEADAPVDAQDAAPAVAEAPATPASEQTNQPSEGVTKTPEQELAAMREQLAQAQHRERSASNRISAFHQQANDATRRAQEAERRLQEAATRAAAAPEPDDPELQALVREMPEIASAVDRLVAKKVAESVGEVRAKVSQVEQGMQPLYDKAREADARAAAEQDRRELAMVEQEFPSWRETVFGDDFKGWIDSKPQAIKTAYANASTAPDALEFLRMYSRERQPAQGQQPNPAKATRRQLERSVGITSRPVSKPAMAMPDENDFEGAFAFFNRRTA